MKMQTAVFPYSATFINTTMYSVIEAGERNFENHTKERKITVSKPRTEMSDVS